MSVYRIVRYSSLKLLKMLFPAINFVRALTVSLFARMRAIPFPIGNVYFAYTAGLVLGPVGNNVLRFEAGLP